MKNIKLILPAALIIMVSLIFGCSKDESATKPVEIDVRDIAIGTYTGLSSLKDTSGNTVLDTSSTFVVAKGAGNTLTITEDGAVIVTDAIVTAGKDFSGNIPSQSIVQTGLTLTIKGKGNNNEHYGFQESTKVFSYGIEITDGSLKGYTIDVFATKK